MNLASTRGNNLISVNNLPANFGLGNLRQKTCPRNLNYQVDFHWTANACCLRYFSHENVDEMNFDLHRIRTF